jgi:hypothetical protein
VARLWALALVAETFHVLPSVAARDLDEDPGQTALVCMSLLRYSEAHRALTGSMKDKDRDEKSLAPWKGNRLMAAAKRNWASLERERMARRAAVQEVQAKG